MFGVRLAALFAPVIYLFGLSIALCWFLGICEPILFVINIYQWMERVILNN
jgi:hypothetical protein